MGISISGKKNQDVTVISNLFIDYFMPHANGLCVKVYLYLLRRLSGKDVQTDLSICSMADSFGDTESDIMRAITYLEKKGLLQVIRLKEGDIQEIYLNDLSAISIPAPEPVIVSAESETAEATSAAAIATPIRSNRVRPEIPTYTKTQIQYLSTNEDIKWIMSVAEKYLERLLTPADIQLILYLYESVGFPPDLILYLYEYCASRSKKSAAYIEAVALSWDEQGVHSIEDAQFITASYNTNYKAIAKAFGLNRMPGEVELKYMDHWIKEYGFPIDIIVEACSRTLLTIQRPDFRYANSILEDWHNNHVKSKQDIERIDQLYSENNAKTNKLVKKNVSLRSTNRFNLFPQRNYSEKEYASLEQKLLVKTAKQAEDFSTKCIQEGMTVGSNGLPIL